MGSVVVTSSTIGMTVNVGSSRASPFFNCKVKIILMPPDYLMLVEITLELRSVISRNFALMTLGLLCVVEGSSFQVPIQTTRLISPNQATSFKETLLETPMMGKVSKLITFILSVSFYFEF